MIPLFTYGDIFFYEDSEYIFLGLDGDELFATKILDVALSDDIRSAYRNVIAKNNEVKQKLLIYQFIELTTPYYKRRIVTLLKVDGYDLSKVSDSIHRSLNRTDCENLKQELLASKGIPLKLKAQLQ